MTILKALLIILLIPGSIPLMFIALALLIKLFKDINEIGILSGDYKMDCV